MKQKKLINIQLKLRNKFLKKGVKMIAPDTVFFSKNTKIGKNVTIEPYVVIADNVSVGDNVKILSFSHLEGVKIENNVNVGPYARLRPGTVLKSGSKIGNFVEIKKSIVGNSSKINHLSYVGDTKIGKKVNIGAGTITCNYDGKNKNKTRIGKNSFVGSNSTIIAPIKIGDNVTMGAGSVFNKSIPNNNLSIGRAYQINKKNKKN